MGRTPRLIAVAVLLATTASAQHDPFFEIKDIDAIVHPMSRIAPSYYGIFEGNDPTRRLMVIANFDNDVPEYWEWSGEGLFPFDASNEAYKLGVNYLIYGMVLGKAETTAAPLPDGIALGPTRTRVTFNAGEPPAIESVPSGRDAVATFTIIDVESKQDAIEWVKRLPRRGGDEEIEIREGGCPGGVPAVNLLTAPRSAGDKRFVVMEQISQARAPPRSRIIPTIERNCPQ